LAESSPSQFCDWLEGWRPKLKPKFRDVVANNLEWLKNPDDGSVRERVHCTYDCLCSYVHAPIRVVEAAKQFYESRPDLTRDQILSTWNGDRPEASGDESDDPAALWLRAKMRHRAASMALTHSHPLGPHW